MIVSYLILKKRRWIFEKKYRQINFLYIYVMHFDLQNSYPMSIFVGIDRKNSIIRKKNIFFRISENIRYGGRVSLRQAAKGLAQGLRSFTSSNAACNLRYFGPEKLINSTLNNTWELVSNWTTIFLLFFSNK